MYRFLVPLIPSVSIIVAVALLLNGTSGHANDAVLDKLVLSTVFVWHVAEGDNDSVAISSGTGWVLDYRHGYIVTNEHVVHGQKEVRISFPEFRDGEVIRSAEHYLIKAPVAKGIVAATDVDRDLAIVKVDAIPSYMRSLNLAKGRLEKQEEIFTIGNKIDIDQVFIPRKGKVLFSGFSVEVKDQNKPIIGDLLYTQSAFVQGNSGGPIVNIQGNLVGVVAAIHPTETYNVNVGVRELKRWLGPPLGFDDSDLHGQFSGTWVAEVTEYQKASDKDGKPPERKRLVGIRNHWLGEMVDCEVFGQGQMHSYTLKHFENVASYKSDTIRGQIGFYLNKGERALAVNPIPQAGVKADPKDDMLFGGLATDAFMAEVEKYQSVPGHDRPAVSAVPTWIELGSLPTKPGFLDTVKPPAVMYGTYTCSRSTLGARDLPGTRPKSRVPRITDPIMEPTESIVFNLEPNDLQFDWSSARWTLRPHIFEGDVAKRLGVEVGDSRPHPSATQLQAR